MTKKYLQGHYLYVEPSNIVHNMTVFCSEILFICMDLLTMLTVGGKELKELLTFINKVTAV